MVAPIGISSRSSSSSSASSSSSTVSMDECDDRDGDVVRAAELLVNFARLFDDETEYVKSPSDVDDEKAARVVAGVSRERGEDDGDGDDVTTDGRRFCE